MTSLYSALSYVDARQYGIVADGTDQYANLSALLASVASGGADPDGAQIILPKGTIGLSQQLIVPDKVSLIGQGKRSTILKALAGFATSTAIVSLGSLTTGVAFDCYLKDLEVDANSIAGSHCVQTTRGQEGAGVRNVLLNNYKANGFRCEATGHNAANLLLQDVECLGASGSTNGILFDTVGGASMIDRVTVNGGSTSGIRIKSSQAVLRGLHFEALTNGLYADGDNAVILADGIVGAGTAVTNLVYISSGRRVVIGNLVKGTATTTLKDDGNGMQLTDTFVLGYGGSRYHGNIKREREAVGSAANAIAIDMSFPDYKKCNTLTENTTVGAPSNAEDGMEMMLRFVQDGTGGKTVGWNAVFKGVTLAASGTANQRAVIVFRYDGTYWYQVGTSGWVT